MNCEHSKCSFAHAMGIYACDLCDYESKLYANLRRHIRTHTQEKPFICTICDRKVSSKISLDVHMKRIHTKEKLNKCEGCDASFYEAVELNRHLRAMHPDLKPRVVCKALLYFSYVLKRAGSVSCAQVHSIIFRTRARTTQLYTYQRKLNTRHRRPMTLLSRCWPSLYLANRF